MRSRFCSKRRRQARRVSGVMQPQDLDVGDPQPLPLDDRHDLGQSRRIAAGKDVFAEPGRCRARPVHAADRVQQRHPVRRQQRLHLGEKRGVMVDADMLEHADRDDAVVVPALLAVIAQMKAHAVGRGRPRRRAGSPPCAARPTGSGRSRRRRTRRRDRAPARPSREPISSTFCPGSSSSLAAMCRFLSCCACSRSSFSPRK